MDFFGMRPQDVEAMAERHYNRLLDEYLREDPEPWDIDRPGWSDVMDLIDCKYTSGRIADIIRDYVERDDDVKEDVYRAALFDRYISDEDRIRRKSPDEEWELLQSVLAAQWENDALFEAIYDWLPEEHLKKIGEYLVEHADENGIRDLYNDAHQDDWRYNPYDD